MTDDERDLTERLIEQVERFMAERPEMEHKLVLGALLEATATLADVFDFGSPKHRALRVRFSNGRK